MYEWIKVCLVHAYSATEKPTEIVWSLECHGGISRETCYSQTQPDVLDGEGSEAQTEEEKCVERSPKKNTFILKRLMPIFVQSWCPDPVANGNLQQTRCTLITS